jgi:N-acetylglucosaminyldiphosphoundecaprenol N-acetyl-beta-D-mannosaminyltransferase
VSEVLSKFRIGSIDFTAARFAEATQEIARLTNTSQNSGTSIHFANAYNIALAEHDRNYQKLMNQGDYVFTDGTPVVWAGKRIHPKGSWGRVYGPDITEWLLAQSTTGGPRHYFLGSTEVTMEKLITNIKTRFPNAQIAGYESPPFREPTESELFDRDIRIRESQASIVWVGLGTPKQDFEARRLAQNLPVTAMAVGAAFDFIAGTVPQAPQWIQKSGLEWSYRLAREPKRLAKRYFWGNPQFIRSVIKHRP